MSRFFAERRVNRTASLLVAVKLVFSTDWDSTYWKAHLEGGPPDFSWHLMKESVLF